MHPSDIPAPFEHRDLDPVALDRIDIEDDFWRPCIRRTQEETIPDLLELADEEGKIENFWVVAGKSDEELALHNVPDSDIYKILEAAAYTLTQRDDPALAERVEDLVDAIVAAQEPSGYLNTQYQLPFDHPASPDRDDDHVQNFGYGPEWQWRSRSEEWPKGYGQLYSAGHLFEAAVAHYRATGEETLLGVATDFADHIEDQFPNAEAVKGYADHPEIGLGLMRLYTVTGRTRYLELAERLVKYVDFSRPPDIGDGEPELPLQDQRNAFGHCVRTMYLYAGGTDVLADTEDIELLKAIQSLWRDIVDTKMYLTGAIGNGTEAEQHGHAYDLPNDESYAETCASIGMGMWNHRLNLLTGDASFADLVELATYNGALVGISLDGTEYFYDNKLAVDEEFRRRRYLFCCPSNVPRLLGGIARWQYAVDESDVYANLFIEGTADIETADGPVHIEQETGYPWDDTVRFELDTTPAEPFALNLRIPGWVRGTPAPGGLYHFPNEAAIDDWSVSINGEDATPERLWNGYARLDRDWQAGDTVELDLPMPVRRVESHPAVDANRDKTAFMRGPMVYCFESVDQDVDLTAAEIPADPATAVEHRGDWLDGVSTISVDARTETGAQSTLTGVPYYAWANRDPGSMRVWLPQS
jgi:DUF1680 family protein